VIVVAIPKVRHGIPSGGLTHSQISRGDSSNKIGRAERSRAASPIEQFLVVVLPDGTIVTPRVAGKV